MSFYRLRPKAVEDLEFIGDFIAADNLAGLRCGVTVTVHFITHGYGDSALSWRLMGVTSPGFVLILGGGSRERDLFAVLRWRKGKRPLLFIFVRGIPPTLALPRKGGGKFSWRAVAGLR